MSLVFRGMATALASGLLAISPIYGQGAQFSLGGGVGIPLGTYDDVVKLGWQATAAISFVPRGLPFGIQIDGTLAQFSDETPLDIKSQLIFSTASAIYHFGSANDAGLHPYLIGGGGVYRSKATGSDAPEGSTTEFGINLGAGFDFTVGAAGLFLESRWHNVLVEGDNLKFLPLTLGIRFGR
jgi:hypothetical protein